MPPESTTQSAKSSVPSAQSSVAEPAPHVEAANHVLDILSCERSGFQTTEFYVAAVALIAVYLAAIVGFLSPQWAGLATVICPGVYQWLRNQRKDDYESSLLTLIDTIREGSAGSEIPHNLIGETVAATPIPTPATSPAVVVSPSSTTSGSAGFITVKTLAALGLIAAFGLLALAYLSGCSSLTPQQQAGLASLADIAIGASAQHYGVSPTETQAITTAANSLFGTAAQAQANIGQTPAQANIAQGASVPAVGAAVQSALPNAPMDQATVNAIFAAAQAAAAKSKPVPTSLWRAAPYPPFSGIFKTQRRRGAEAAERISPMKKGLAATSAVRTPSDGSVANPKLANDRREATGTPTRVGAGRVTARLQDGDYGVREKRVARLDTAPESASNVPRPTPSASPALWVPELFEMPPPLPRPQFRWHLELPDLNLFDRILA